VAVRRPGEVDLMEWARDKEFGGLRYCLRYGPGFLHMATLTRRGRSDWDLITADRVQAMAGNLKDVKNKAEGMLGL
jgi:hypothetical protein